MDIYKKIEELDPKELGILLSLILEKIEDREFLELFPEEIKEIYNQIREQKRELAYRLISIIGRQLFLRKELPRALSPLWIERVIDNEAKTGLYTEILGNLPKEIYTGERNLLDKELSSYLFKRYFPFPFLKGGESLFIEFFKNRSIDSYIGIIGEKVIQLAKKKEFYKIFNKIVRILNEHFEEIRMNQYSIGLSWICLSLNRKEFFEVLYLLDYNLSNFLYDFYRIKDIYFEKEELEKARDSLKNIIKLVWR